MTGHPPGTIGRDANVLGALGLVIADQTSAAIVQASGQSVSGAAALSALDQFLDRPSLDDLRRVLGLTPSGAVRVVDRLVDAGLVTRGPGSDRRSRSLGLTQRGRRVAARITAARAAVLRSMFDPLSPAQRESLSPLLDALVQSVVAGKDGGAWICRLCDLDACERAAGKCPAANATARKFAAAD